MTACLDTWFASAIPPKDWPGPTMTNRASGMVGFAAAELLCAVPGRTPFRNTGAGWTGASVQAANPLVKRSATVTPHCCLRPMPPHPSPRVAERIKVTPHRPARYPITRGEGSARSGTRDCTRGEPRHGRINLPLAPPPHRKLIRNCPIEHGDPDIKSNVPDALEGPAAFVPMLLYGGRGHDCHRQFAYHCGRGETVVGQLPGSRCETSLSAG